MLRIALFTETFLPKVDGIVNTLCHLLDHLAGREHASLLFAPQGALSRQWAILNERVWRLSPAPTMLQWHTNRYTYSSVFIR